MCLKLKRDTVGGAGHLLNKPYLWLFSFTAPIFLLSTGDTLTHLQFHKRFMSYSFGALNMQNLHSEILSPASAHALPADSTCPSRLGLDNSPAACAPKDLSLPPRPSNPLHGDRLLFYFSYH